MTRVQIVAQADVNQLLIRYARCLTKRGVMRDSVRASVDMAGLQDRHFLDAARKHAARPLALQRYPGEQLKPGDVGNVRPRPNRIRHPAK